MKNLPLTDVTEHVSCVRLVPLFGGLSPADQDAVGALARPTALDRGQAFGPATGRLAVVHRGQVKVSRMSAGGHERVLRLAGPGDFVGEGSFLTGEAPTYLIEATAPTRMCVFSRADLAPLIAAHPSVAMAMLRSLTQRLDDAEHRLSLTSTSRPARIAGYLLDQPGVAGRGGYRVRLPMAKKDTASLLGMTPESFSRGLDALRSKGLIATSGPEITLRDVDALEELAAG
ncbi:Crp/Fnr family transcriptional regulator [Acidipropionibacterium virtanenii]|uniref:Fumarate and nitrate reduction regulatory protein n=1 Tax=Acidipropionibacterium virtanenii TaxID=2057246 RepID=A0A344UY47_9ACTN|nr:Crp/Fnr family transcriptional regulator [Acidipropionibacterium virtanenii]AXE40195.1 Fumarate and nitrate reduction regulatory protein [Acidipropionibacterium virtanenii]